MPKGLDPVADAFDNSGSVNFGRGIDAGLWAGVVRHLHRSRSHRHVQTWTVDACDDVVPTNVTKIPFWYREVLTGDTEGAITRAVAADGFTVTAGSSKIVLVEVEAKDLPAGKSFVRLVQTAEPVDMTPAWAGS